MKKTTISSPMEIKPTLGVGELTFGMLKDEVESILGAPEEVEEPEDIEFDWEKWNYKSLGLELSFIPCDKYRLYSFYIKSTQVNLQGHSIMGMGKHELFNRFPNLALSASNMYFELVTCPNTDFEITLRKGLVYSVDLSANLREFLNEYSEEWYKRMIASKRLSKKSIRRCERLFVSQLDGYWDKVDNSNLTDFEINLRSFIGERVSMDVFPESMWCDGVDIDSVKFKSNNLVVFKGTATIVASDRDDFYEDFRMEGAIKLNNKRDEMKSYKIQFEDNDNVYFAKKGRFCLPIEFVAGKGTSAFA